MVIELPVEKLRREFNSALLECETTEDLTPLEGIIGQDRGVKALKFGLDIKERGFNIYVAGAPGTGRTTAVKDFVDVFAKTKLVPSDWCYVNNFRNSYEPKSIQLPPGMGKVLQQDVKGFIDEVRRELPKVFESEDYVAKREETIRSIEDERRGLFAQLNRRAQEEGFLLQSTSMGILMIPLRRGKPMSNEEILALSPQIREEIEKKREKLGTELRNATRQLRSLEKKANEAIQKLNQEVTLYAIGHLILDLSTKYQKFPDITTHLTDIQNDILENVTQFIQEPKPSPQMPFQVPWLKERTFRKYEVNVIVNNSDLTGAPVTMEFNPTYPNLFGRIEKEAQFGVLSTDFTMIRGGSLHKANGGYLVLQVEDLVRNLFSYDSLKRALMNECIRIEEAGERLGFITTKGLKPEPIPLNVKTIIIGNPFLYQQLYALDPDFKELFKVKSDFDIVMDRTPENTQKYAAFICTFCRKEKLNHLDASGVAQIIEYGSRLAADQEKLSTKLAEIADIIREANFYAKEEEATFITEDHVRKAIEEKKYRSNLIQEKIQEMIERNTLLINTEGEVTGQVNGLFVMSLGDFAFGAPSRVTATVGLGQGGIIDIQRESKLGGPIHTKGVMILSGYLSEKYAQDKPLSLSARLVFEQSYGMVEGDSASSTELYAILSELSDVPVNQSMAVTGSVNQKGEVQAIGGVNEKIEGFFEICKVKGLTKQQGALIPDSNVKNLMLKEEVVNAVRMGLFHIYPVKTIDEGIELLTGRRAGKRQLDGTFEEGTITYLVEQKLNRMAERLKEFPGQPSKKRKELE
jgi:lon-related putative ATP-dependent protease